MKNFIKYYLGIVLGAFGLTSIMVRPVDEKPNILFIAIDDLRPELNCYGKKHIISPNIDKLAVEGTLFQNHFVSVPTCGASRHSLLTGRRPQSLVHISNEASAKLISGKTESEIPETFIHQLKRQGYYTVGIGKISHYPDGHVYSYEQSPENKPLELPHSWNEMLLNWGKWGSGHNAFFGFANGTNRNRLKGQVKPYEAAEVGDEGYVDGLTAQLAMEKLGQLKQQEKPFFLAVGFFKPHLPFNAPKKYWDMYDENSIKLAPYNTLPQNTSRASLQTNSEINSYQLYDEKATLDQPVSDAYARRLRHGYYACVSYIDAQVGKVLAALEAQGLAENTIIVLWGDHGWHLGDNRVWGKHTCFDVALRSPLIIKHPKMGRRLSSKAIVSSIDIYPTLMDFCNIRIPFPIDGKSLKPILEKSPTKDERVAYSYYNKGVSVRTERYRMTQYFRNEQPLIELYDLKKDPHETVNIAQAQAKTVKTLMPLLEKGNTGLYQK
jgi:arylsulfatase A-like enzyme